MNTQVDRGLLDDLVSNNLQDLAAVVFEDFLNMCAAMQVVGEFVK